MAWGLFHTTSHRCWEWVKGTLFKKGSFHSDKCGGGSRPVLFIGGSFFFLIPFVFNIVALTARLISLLLPLNCSYLNP